MSDQSAQRIGDSERDRAAECLRDHMAAGRLDQAEFDDRVTRALSARTAADIEPLFTDLPDPRPGSELVAPPAPQPSAAGTPAVPTAPGSGPSSLAFAARVLTGIAWPAVIIILAATGNWGSWWWLFMIPVFISGWAGRLNGDEHPRHRHRNRSIDR